MFTSLATPGIAIVLLNMGMGAVGVAIAQLSMSLILLALNVRFSCFRLGMRFSFRRFDLALFRAIAVFSAWIFINQVCDLVNQSVPNMVLGAVTSATVVAVFAVSIQIRSVFVSLSTVMSSVFVPKINQIVAETDDNLELTKLMTRVGRYQMLLFCWVYCGFVLLGRFFCFQMGRRRLPGRLLSHLRHDLAARRSALPEHGHRDPTRKNRHKARSVVYLFMALLNVAFTWAASPLLGYWLRLSPTSRALLWGTACS